MNAVNVEFVRTNNVAAFAKAKAKAEPAAALDERIELVVGRECLEKFGGDVTPETVRHAIGHYSMHATEILCAAITHLTQSTIDCHVKVGLIQKVTDAAMEQMAENAAGC